MTANSTTAPIATAILGYGYSAKTFHEPFLRQLDAFRLIAASGSTANEAQLFWPGLVVCKTAQQAIALPEVELVIITTPNDSHFELARQALLAGKHVLIDKPMVCSSHQALQLEQLATQQNRVLSTYHNRRWDGDFLTLQTLIRQNQLGRIKRFESHFDRARPTPKVRWREQQGEGTGIWFDLAPHLLDQCVQLFGLPEAISGEIARLRPGAEADDYFHIHLHYPDLSASLHSSPYCYGRPLRYDVQGEQARYVKYGLDPQEERLKAGKAFATASWSADEFANFGRIHWLDRDERVATEAGRYQTLFEQLARAIRYGEKNPVPVDQVTGIIRLLELGQEAAKSGCRVPL